MRKRKMIILIVLTILVSTLLAKSPEEMASDYFKYLENDEWNKVAELYSEDSLIYYRNGIMDIVSSSNMVKMFFGKDMTFEKVDELSDSEFFGKILENTTGAAFQRGDIDYLSTEIIGSVKESKNITHVLTRIKESAAGVTAENMRIFSFQKGKSGWKLLLDNQIKAMLSSTKNKMK